MQLPTPQDKLAEYDARLSRIEGIVEQMNTRLTSLESKVEQGQRDLSNRVDRGRRDARTDFRWLVGIIISTQLTTLITLGTLILVKLG